MNGDAIEKVTLALRDRLVIALSNGGIFNPSVFVGPLDDAQVGPAMLILFLYRIVPNANLRNSEHTVATGEPRPKVYRNSLPLDLYYLITAGQIEGAEPSDGSEERALIYLGLAMQELQATPMLTGPQVQHQAVNVSLEPLSTDESSRIWNLFPTANYRTSIAYLASPVWIDPLDPGAIGRPVVVDSLHAGHKEPVAAL